MHCTAHVSVVSWLLAGSQFFPVFPLRAHGGRPKLTQARGRGAGRRRRGRAAAIRRYHQQQNMMCPADVHLFLKQDTRIYKNKITRIL